jgi:hypothetical protein
MIKGAMGGVEFYSFLLDTIEKVGLYGEKVVFVLDNLRAHKIKDIYPILLNKINLFFLPAYTPMLNNIEYFFSLLKRNLKTRVYRSIDDIVRKIEEFILITDSEIYANIERHCISLVMKVLINQSIV